MSVCPSVLHILLIQSGLRITAPVQPSADCLVSCLVSNFYEDSFSTANSYVCTDTLASRGCFDWYVRNRGSQTGKNFEDDTDLLFLSGFPV